MWFPLKSISLSRSTNLIVSFRTKMVQTDKMIRPCNRTRLTRSRVLINRKRKRPINNRLPDKAPPKYKIFPKEKIKRRPDKPKTRMMMHLWMRERATVRTSKNKARATRLKRPRRRRKRKRLRNWKMMMNLIRLLKKLKKGGQRATQSLRRETMWKRTTQWKKGPSDK